jgi:Cu(I)/Ag(I) efflux system membrane protein CusA/SilA
MYTGTPMSTASGTANGPVPSPPLGTYVTWSGQFEYLERAKARLKIVVPVTVLIISCCSISTSAG